MLQLLGCLCHKFISCCLSSICTFFSSGDLNPVSFSKQRFEVCCYCRFLFLCCFSRFQKRAAFYQSLLCVFCAVFCPRSDAYSLQKRMDRSVRLHSLHTKKETDHVMPLILSQLSKEALQTKAQFVIYYNAVIYSRKHAQYNLEQTPVTSTCTARGPSFSASSSHLFAPLPALFASAPPYNHAGSWLSFGVVYIAVIVRVQYGDWAEHVYSLTGMFCSKSHRGGD